MRILLVEDDERIVEFVKRGIEAEGHSVVVTSDGTAARSLAGAAMFDVLILDIMLPGYDGRELCKELRHAGIATPVLMLTALDALEDKVKGLRMGADDYLTKPFSFEELLARIEALGRRSGSYTETQQVMQIADLVVDRERKRVTRGDKIIELTPREFALLDCLIAGRGKVLSRSMLLERVWGYASDPLTNVVEVYIRQLRLKIDAGHPNALIQTVRGFGYKIDDARA